MVTEISPRWSWKGYEFGEWLKKNKGFLKNLIVSVVTAYIFLKMFMDGNHSIEAIVAASVVGGTALKKILDFIDFGINEVELK